MYVRRMDTGAAGPVAVSVEVGPSLGRAGDDAGLGGALGVAGELGLGRGFAAEAKVRGGAYADGHRGADALLGLRAWLKPASEPLSFAVVGLVGATVVPDPAPQAWLGLDLGVDSDRPVSFRAGLAGQLLSLGSDSVLGAGSPVAAEAHIALVWRPHREVTPVVIAPAPPPSARVVWVPHPVCAWVPVDQLSTVLGDLPGETPVWVTEPGLLPGGSSLARAGGAALVKESVQGAVVVGGAGGDRVRVAGTDLAVGDSRGVVLTVPPGSVRADVTGGGRSAVVEGAVADGYVLWLRAPAPEPVSVRFAQGSSTLDDRAVAEVRTLAERRGGAAYEVRGGYSSEGDPIANAALATARAEAVRAALVAAGVPSEHVRVTAAAPIVGDTEASRVAIVTPRGGP